MADNTIPAPQQDPVLASAAAAVQQANAQVQAAKAQLQATSPYVTGSNPQPHMPVPSMKAGLFPNASPRNLANEHPTTVPGMRNKAIGQIAGLGAQIVGSYFKKKEQEKTQALAMDINKSLELNSGLQEGKAAMEQAQAILNNPNASPEEKQQAQAQLQQAQVVIKKNSSLLTSLLNGKSGKDIAKAYDITFGDESKSSSLEDKSASMHHQAMQIALKQGKEDTAKAQAANPAIAPQAAQGMNGAPNMGRPALPNVRQMTPQEQQMQQRGSSRLEQFQAGQPARMGANPAYTAAYGAYKDAVANAQKAQKDALDTYTKLHKDDAELAKEEMHDKSEAGIHAADSAERLKAAQLQLEGNLAKAAATRANAWARLQASRNVQSGERIKAATDIYNQATGSIKEIDGRIDDITKQQEKMVKDDAKDPVLSKQLSDNLTTLQQERQKQVQLQYAANLGMSDDPQGEVLRNQILDPSKYQPSTPTPVVAAPKPSLLQRGIAAAQKAKQVYKEVAPHNQKSQDEEE